MKLCVILITVTSLGVAAAGHTQNITFSGREVPLEKAFSAIKQQTGYVVFFEYSLLREAQPVTVDAKNEPLTVFLDQLFSNQPLSYTIEGKTILITRRPPPPPATENTSPPSPNDVHGRVTDSLGNPLAGASVAVKGSRRGTKTNADGYFDLKEADENTTLIISFTGFESREFRTGSTHDVRIVLRPGNNVLDNVQVIAYGTSSRRLTTGNIASVSAEDIEKQPVTNPLLALEGRVPGLFITQSSGVAGAGVLTQIQGQNSIANGNDPFFVIDGVPYTSQLLRNNNASILGITGIQTYGYAQYNGVQSNGNPLSFINPDDIESITVLKDAEATAIYGSRAANGAILVTTKKAHAGVTKINVNLQNGWGSVTRHVPLLNTQQYLEMRREAMANDGVTASPTDYDINGTWDTTRYTDWQKKLIGNTAQYTTFYADVSGGNANIQALFGMTYHKETSVFANNFTNSVPTVHFSINANSSNRKFSAQLTGSYMVNHNKLPNTDMTSIAMGLPPDAPALLNPDGSINWAPNAAGVSTLSYNPYAQFLNLYDNQTNNLTSNAVLIYSPIPGLNVKASFGYTNLQSNDIATYPLASTAPENRAAASPFASYGNNDINTWLAEPQITYNFKAGIGKFEALIGATFQQQGSNGYTFSGTGYSSDALLNDINAAVTIYPGNQISALYRYNALSGRINYNINDEYIVEGTVRRDGSSRFGANNEVHDFGSVGAAWVLSELKAVKNIHWISFAKLKGSYGTTGNDQIGDYQYLSLYSSNVPGIPYQGSARLIPNGLPNPNLQWEQTRKLNFGLDLGLLTNRILIGADYYQNRSSNQLLSYPLSSVAGFSSILENLPATIQNSGWEITWTSQNIKTRHFQWTTNFNITIPQNKLIRFDNLANSSYAFNYQIGKPITSTRAWNLAGVNPQTGFYEIIKANGKRTSTDFTFPDDMTQWVNLAQKYYGGIDNQFTYKGFNLDVLFQFVNRMAQNYKYLNGPNGSKGNRPIWVLDRWRKPGDIATYEKFSTGNNPFDMGNTYWGSSSSVQEFSNGAYIRLKNLALSWTVPNSWIKKGIVQNMSISLLAQNLLTFTKYPGIDPESLDYSTLPPLRTITLGIKATF